jgi:hypothetical protein
VQPAGYLSPPSHTHTFFLRSYFLPFRTSFTPLAPFLPLFRIPYKLFN